MRSYARETAFCKLYSYLITGNVDDDLSQFDQDKLTDEDKLFALDLLHGVIKGKNNYDAIIAEMSKSYKLSRIYRLDLAALEIAVYEISNKITPAPVAINEAVTLAKKYSTEKSISFVNGILAAYQRSLQ